MGEMSYEESRRLIKKEYQKPNVYSVNRVSALLTRAEREHGNKARRELEREIGVRMKNEK